MLKTLLESHIINLLSVTRVADDSLESTGEHFTLTVIVSMTQVKHFAARSAAAAREY